jgi:hypothetical protein
MRNELAVPQTWPIDRAIARLSSGCRRAQSEGRSLSFGRAIELALALALAAEIQAADLSPDDRETKQCWAVCETSSLMPDGALWHGEAERCEERRLLTYRCAASQCCP